MGKVKQRSDGMAPLFLSDAWFYENALYNTYCRYAPVPYKGRGRPPLPLQIIDERLKYAQVYKERDSKGKLKSITTRIIIGIESEIMAIIRKNGRSKTINTSFVESRNGKYPTTSKNDLSLKESQISRCSCRFFDRNFQLLSPK